MAFSRDYKMEWTSGKAFISKILLTGIAQDEESGELRLLIEIGSPDGTGGVLHSFPLTDLKQLRGFAERAIANCPEILQEMQ